MNEETNGEVEEQEEAAEREVERQRPANLYFFWRPHIHPQEAEELKKRAQEVEKILGSRPGAHMRFHAAHPPEDLVVPTRKPA